VKSSSNIRRWDDHHEFLEIRVFEDPLLICMEELPCLPPRVPRSLNLLGYVLICHGLGHVLLLASRGSVDNKCWRLLFLFLSAAHGGSLGISFFIGRLLAGLALGGETSGTRNRLRGGTSCHLGNAGCTSPVAHPNLQQLKHLVRLKVHIH
jgi:hypothetical protein